MATKQEIEAASGKLCRVKLIDGTTYVGELSNRGRMGVQIGHMGFPGFVELSSFFIDKIMVLEGQPAAV